MSMMFLYICSFLFCIFLRGQEYDSFIHQLLQTEQNQRADSLPLIASLYHRSVVQESYYLWLQGQKGELETRVACDKALMIMFLKEQEWYHALLPQEKTMVDAFESYLSEYYPALSYTFLSLLLEHRITIGSYIQGFHAAVKNIAEELHRFIDNPRKYPVTDATLSQIKKIAEWMDIILRNFAKITRVSIVDCCSSWSSQYGLNEELMKTCTSTIQELHAWAQRNAFSYDMNMFVMRIKLQMDRLNRWFEVCHIESMALDTLEDDKDKLLMIPRTLDDFCHAHEIYKLLVASCTSDATGVPDRIYPLMHGLVHEDPLVRRVMYKVFTYMEDTIKTRTRYTEGVDQRYDNAARQRMHLRAMDRLSNELKARSSIPVLSDAENLYISFVRGIRAYPHKEDALFKNIEMLSSAVKPIIAIYIDLLASRVSKERTYTPQIAVSRTPSPQLSRKNRSRTGGSSTSVAESIETYPQKLMRIKKRFRRLSLPVSLVKLYEDTRIAAYRQYRATTSDEAMVLVLYLQEKKPLYVFELTTECFAKMEDSKDRPWDRFHMFDRVVDEYCCYGVIILPHLRSLYKRLLNSLNIYESHDQATLVLLEGRILGKYHDYTERDEGFAGYFVYIVMPQGRCIHRCFHQLKES